MPENNLQDVAARKAYEIAYALCRIAPVVQSPSLGNVLIKKGIELLDVVLESDRLKTERFLDAIDYFLKLAYGIDLVSQRNVDILLGQTGFLREMVRGLDMPAYGRKGKPADVDLSGIFSDGFGNEFEVRSRDKAESHKNPISGDPATENNIVDKQEESLPAIPLELEESEENQNSGFAVSLSSGVRQSAILSRIRQSGNCRIKDLQEILPQCSERTLRYDLEYLMGRHLIERVGAGSATAYRPAEIGSPPSKGELEGVRAKAPVSLE
jgi:hypothetical protein